MMLILVAGGWCATVAFGQSVVLTDGGVAYPDGSVQSTAAFAGTAPLAKTGQTSCFDASGNLTLCGTGVGAGQEGHLRRGVEWPIPRFTKNGDGTVTDNMTGLIWLEDANCADTTVVFDDALAFANTLYDGSTAHSGGDCGLSDGSVAGDWRVPNMFEATSLMDHGYANKGVPNTTGTGQWGEGDPFSDIQPTYWTSTFNPQNKTFAHNAWYQPPFLSSNVKSALYSVWPVRGPVGGGGPAQTAIVLADGGIQFPDGSVQSTAASVRVVIPKTGQEGCYNSSGSSIPCAGTGQDGDHRAGVAWPNPRFTINGDGTVTDNMTGLVWLEDASCGGSRTWTSALEWASARLFDGSIDAGGVNQDCGLSDGSLPGEWGVPTLAEYESLAYMEADNPAVPNTAGTGQWAEGDPFIGIPSGNVYWWSSTTVESGPGSAYLGFLRSHATATSSKTGAYQVWAVRDSR
jgi:hypothetical protein